MRKTVAPAASDSGRQEPVNTLDEGGVTFEGGEVKAQSSEDEENSGPSGQRLWPPGTGEYFG